MRTAIFLATLAATSCGCAASSRPELIDSSGFGETGIDAPETSESSSGGPSPELPPSPSFDLGGAADDGMNDEGCSKIDFLFVVDNSSSMGNHQSALLDSFGGFMDTIATTVSAHDFHLMVVDSDAGDDIERACEPCPGEGTQCGDWCTTKASLDLECETALGAGEVAPHTQGASNRVCGLPDGQRFLTSATAPDELEELFACVGNVGIKGSSAEMPMSAMVASVTQQSEAGGCNEGFLRDDAILVVTVITDDYPVPHSSDDANEVGSPQAWYDALVEAKQGAPDSLVVLGILNTADATCVSGAGDPITHPTERFVSFMDHVGERGMIGNICETSYDGFFAEAVGLIDSTCDDYLPEG